MQISEIRIKLVDNRNDRLKAFCSVTFDNSFVVRDLKIIEGTDGYFIAMPSRKLTDRCRSCGAKNHLRARYCNECGSRLDESRANRKDDSGRVKLHADVAHPVNAESREYIQQAIVEAYSQEVELSQQPDYRPTILGDDYEDNYPHSRHQKSDDEADKPVKPSVTRQIIEHPKPEPEHSTSKRSSFSEGIL